MSRIAAALLCTLASAGLSLADEAAQTAPPEAPFVQVSSIVALPEFIPGLGTLYVDPATLPAGPFLSYDHDGKLSATVYMVPLEDLTAGTAFDGLAVGAPTVTSVDIYYNAGHPGVEKPHAHIVLYHDAGAEDRLAE